ncbi:MAG TPA: PAS domain S-box protein, partial [Vicinamibacterales bacterium]|nr:PAS domain S-box protein [Vicinamibacterales bacterium]
MAMVAPTGHWMEVNPALCAIVGYSREELLATTFQRLTHPEDLDADLDLVRRTLAREIETYQMEKRYFHKDGRIVWIQLNATMVWNQDGAPRYFVSQIQDISARKAAEAQLRAMNDRYARQEGALAALARLDIVKLDDLPALLREVTEVVSRTLGVERVSLWKLDDALARLTCSDLYTSSNDRHSGGFELETGDYPAYFEAISGLDVVAAHRAETDPRTREFWPHYLRPLGISSMMDTPVHLRGEPVGVLCCEHVGPPRIWTPDEQTFSVAVASMLAALHAQVERQKVEAQLRQSQKLEAIGQLAGGIAHDFNNTLTAIRGYGELLAAALPDDEQLRRYAEEIRKTAEAGAALPRQLLAFGRKEPLQLKELELNEVVAGSCELLRPLLGGQIDVVWIP